MKTTKMSLSRRDALKKMAVMGSGLFITSGLSARSLKTKNKNLPGNSPGILAIGVNSRGMHVALHACNYGKVVACCDPDTATFGKFRASVRQYQDEDPVFYTDYRDALEQKDVDIVIIGAPDHWHTLMLVDSLAAGKDVYIEKPLTLTIAEGIALCEAVRKSDRVVQVGTQQRSEFDGIFLKAVAIAKEGILGKKINATAYLPKSRTSKEVYPITDPPDSLNWDMWCGPLQYLPYCPQRCHSDWRGWVEAGYGTITDWGAHHIDIAQWALGVDHTGPVEIIGEGVFPHGKKTTLDVITGKKPSSSLPNSFSVVRNYHAKLKYENGTTLQVTDKPMPSEYSRHRNGLLLEGENGSIFMSRMTRGFDFDGTLGKKIKNDKAMQQKINNRVIRLYKRKTPAYLVEEMDKAQASTAHMKNFIDCVMDRSEPISDVFTAHRANSTAILANASMLLGKPLKWNPDKQEFVGDALANQLLSRAYR